MVQDPTVVLAVVVNTAQAVLETKADILHQKVTTAVATSTLVAAELVQTALMVFPMQLAAQAAQVLTLLLHGLQLLLLALAVITLAVEAVVDLQLAAQVVLAVVEQVRQ
jgi:hypothetical protein